MITAMHRTIRIAASAVAILGLAAANIGVIAPAAAATKAPAPKKPIVRVVGKAKFVLKGQVVSVGTGELAVDVKNTTKNAKTFDGKKVVLKVAAATKITKNGKRVALKAVPVGGQVKVFGIFDAKTGAVTSVRWIKVLP